MGTGLLELEALVFDALRFLSKSMASRGGSALIVWVGRTVCGLEGGADGANRAGAGAVTTEEGRFWFAEGDMVKPFASTLIAVGTAES